MGFKDCANNPEPTQQYTPARAVRFGGAMVASISDVVPYVRAGYPFTGAVGKAIPTALPPVDAYRLYGYWRSSSAWRVRIALELKGIPFENVSVPLAQGGQSDPS